MPLGEMIADLRSHTDQADIANQSPARDDRSVSVASGCAWHHRHSPATLRLLAEHQYRVELPQRRIHLLYGQHYHRRRRSPLRRHHVNGQRRQHRSLTTSRPCYPVEYSYIAPGTTSDIEDATHSALHYLALLIGRFSEITSRCRH